jgi:hypothetical protein
MQIGLQTGLLAAMKEMKRGTLSCIMAVRTISGQCIMDLLPIAGMVL